VLTRWEHALFVTACVLLIVLGVVVVLSTGEILAAEVAG
jgi:hypothetical protein